MNWLRRCPQGTIDLSAATNSANIPGLKWEERASYCRNIPNTADYPAYDPKTTYINFKCVYSLDYIYKVSKGGAVSACFLWLH